MPPREAISDSVIAEGTTQVRYRWWTRVLAGVLITLQVVGAAFFAMFYIALIGCNLFGHADCMTGFAILGSLAVLGAFGGLLAWWIYSLARMKRAGLAVALIVQALAIVAGAVTTVATGETFAVWALVPGVITLVILLLDGGLRRCILSPGTI